MRWVLVMVVLCACKKDPCDQAMDHAFGLKDMATVLGLDATDMPAAREGAKQSCKMTPWDPAATSCLADAGGAAQLEHCMKLPSIERWYGVQLEQLDPSGTHRFAEVDAMIDAMRPALLLAEPTESISACAGPVEVVAIDHEAARLIAAGRAAREGTHFTTPSAIDAVVRYASKSKLFSGDVATVRAWASTKPREIVWGFVETKTRHDPERRKDMTFVEGSYEGVLHVVDPKTKTVLCHTPITARSSDSVETVVLDNARQSDSVADDMLARDFSIQVGKAVSDKLAVLRAGKDAVTLPDPATDNSGPPLAEGRIADGATWYCTHTKSQPNVTMCDRDKATCDGYVKTTKDPDYAKCSTQGTAICFTYRDLEAETDAYACHARIDSCLSHRLALKNEPQQASQLSGCYAVASTAK